jgi:hypothetical protein
MLQKKYVDRREGKICDGENYAVWDFAIFILGQMKKS